MNGPRRDHGFALLAMPELGPPPIPARRKPRDPDAFGEPSPFSSATGAPSTNVRVIVDTEAGTAVVPSAPATEEDESHRAIVLQTRIHGLAGLPFTLSDPRREAKGRRKLSRAARKAARR